KSTPWSGSDVRYGMGTLQVHVHFGPAQPAGGQVGPPGRPEVAGPGGDQVLRGDPGPAHRGRGGTAVGGLERRAGRTPPAGAAPEGGGNGQLRVGTVPD